MTSTGKTTDTKATDDVTDKAKGDTGDTAVDARADGTAGALPVFFVSHGGGPWPWMPEQKSPYAGLAAALRRMPGQVGTTPRAILMVSAHWEEEVFSLTGHARPPMIHDYSGFPAHTYRVVYPAPGAPWLARRARDLLGEAGIAARVDPERGFDHGMFSPMAEMWPEADVPVVQLSLRAGLDPREHLAAGRALAPLRREGVLLVGRGLSYHNLRDFGAAARRPSAEFDAWIAETMAIGDASARAAALADWERAPSARAAHPREEHLLPLMVAVGAAGDDAATRVYHEADFLGAISVSNFRFAAERTPEGEASPART